MASTPNVTTVTERGQVSIPAGLRDELALAQGKKLRWEKVNDHELRVVVLEDRPPGAKAMLGFARRLHRKPRRTSDWMKELREGED